MKGMLPYHNWLKDNTLREIIAKTFCKLFTFTAFMLLIGILKFSSAKEKEIAFTNCRDFIFLYLNPLVMLVL